MKQAEQKGSDLKFSYMFWLPFTAVFREGIETVIFLAGTSSNYEVRSVVHGGGMRTGGRAVVQACAW